ncbi:MAG TPA: DUF2332 domain-containing protein [Streptosporangiaceae bacterium]|nr:DUF2332 domain-containing protein [Streptosporangiaceae bacterium]
MSQDAAQLDRLRLLFRLFATTQCRGRSPVYEALSQAIAGDEQLLRLLLAAPAAQRRPSLFLAAVNLLLAARPGAALAAYYPTHGGHLPPDAGLWPAFTAFCAAHRDELAELLAQRSTQTNEIRRCVALRLGLSRVARRWPGPVALAELGASAGLNLLADHYHYRLNGADFEQQSGSAVRVNCEIRNRVPAAEVLGDRPQITSRIGVDQDPVDLSDPAALAWLEAFIWPEQTADLATLRAAAGLHAALPGPAVVRGDATTDTVRLLGELPGDEPIVVFTASLLSYLEPGPRAAFAGQLALASRRRRVAWVFAEASALVAATGLLAPGLADGLVGNTAEYLVGVSFRDPAGGQEDQLLAMADPYLRWLAPFPAS